MLLWKIFTSKQLLLWYYKLFLQMFLHLYTQTWLPILTIIQLRTYALPNLSLLSEPYQHLFQIHKAKIELLSFSSKLCLHLSYNNKKA